MRTILVALLLTAALAGCLSGDDNGEPGGPDGDDFGPELVVTKVVHVDAERWSGEPSMLALQDGTLLITGVSGFTRYVEDPTDIPCRFGQSYLWRSTDDGDTWDFVDLVDNECVFYRNLILGIEGDLAEDDAGRAYFVDLTMFPGVNGLSASDDSGESWLAAQAPIIGLPATDRPWVAAVGDGEVFVKYLTQLNAGGGPLAPWRVARSTDGGQIWLEDVPIPNCGQADMYIDPWTKELLIPCQGNPITFVKTATGQAMQWTEHHVADAGPAIANFASMAVAGEGHYIFSWVERLEGTNVVRMALSTDAGETWTEPMDVTTFEQSSSFVWVDADDDGRVGLVWYQADEPGDPNEMDAEWYAKHGAFTFVDGGASDMVVQNITDDPVHVGSICSAGLGCVLEGRANDRRLLDFFEIDIRHGKSHVTWTSTQGPVPTVWYGQLAWPMDSAA